MHPDDKTDPSRDRDTGIRLAATLVVVREGVGGIEVLLLRRADSGDLRSGAWVFPGGVIDPSDRDCHACCDGLDDVAASARLGMQHGGLDFYVAAVRECFEESGLLFACDTGGEPCRADEAGDAFRSWRGPLHRGERSLAQLCREEGLRLAVDRLEYLSHWLSPRGLTKRFDTRFFLALAPPAQTAAHDAAEMVAQQWLRPTDALGRRAALKLMRPTQTTLEVLAQFDSVQSLFDWARSPRRIELTAPRLGAGRHGLRPVLPTEPAFAEIGRMDPQGLGLASYEMQPGRAVRLSPHVIRVTAGNAGAMTGPGTNSYLVGGGERNEWAVIDPGPIDPVHVDALLAAAPGPVRWIFATHTHLDHSPAAALLKARTGARVYGQRAAHSQGQDPGFMPDERLSGEERFCLNECATLRVLHTPGHASNHLCYLLEEEKMLFTGDHVMQASTVVINPPDGDMVAYIASLRRLLDEDLDWLAPGHGFLMDQPRRALRRIIEHRARREAKVLEVLRVLGPAPVEALLASVYDDVPQAMHPVAMRSLLAHLIKLRDAGQAADQGGRWSAAALRPVASR